MLSRRGPGPRLKKLAPLGFPDAVRIANHDRDLHVVGKPDGAPIGVLGWQVAADLVGAPPAPTGGGREYDRSGGAVIVALQDQSDRVGLDFADLLKPVLDHDFAPQAGNVPAITVR